MRGKPVLIASMAVAAVALGGAALAGDRDDNNAAGLARVLAGLTPGKPMTCLPTFQSSDTSVKAYGDDLVYSAGPSLKYVTHTGGGCSGAGRNDILVTRQFGSAPCQGDIARTIDRTARFPTGSCALGNFVEYRK